MSGLSQKEVKELLDSLDEQGALLMKVKKGVLVKFPDGSMTTVHRTNSDYRSTLNMRAVVKRAGLAWPFDHDRKDTQTAMRLTPERRELLMKVVEEAGDGPVSAAAIAAKAEVADPTAKNALIRGGFTQVRRGVWVRNQPEEKAPAQEGAEAVVQTDGERNFIDDVDSWVVPVPKKLQKMADLMGLNIEVRVWRP